MFLPISVLRKIKRVEGNNDKARNPEHTAAKEGQMMKSLCILVSEVASWPYRIVTSIIYSDIMFSQSKY